MVMRSNGGDREEYKLPEAWAGIEARPLVSLDVIRQVQSKNPALTLYWGNKNAGEGLRYNQLIAGGFVPARPDQLHMLDGKKPIPPSMVKEGHVMYGDLIAMLIGTTEYIAALKQNALRAIALGDRMRLKDTVAPEVKHNLTARMPSELARKISTFVPTEAEVDRMSEKNEKEGQKLG